MRDANMKNILLTLMVFGIVGCVESISEREKSNDYLRDRDGITYEWDGKDYTKPFSGTRLGHYPCSVKVSPCFDNKLLAFRAKYKNGVKNGLTEMYCPYEWGCKLIYSLNFKDGLKDGLSEAYFVTTRPSTRLRVRANFKDGVLDGLREEYFDNRKLRVKANFKNGVLDGLREEYFDNGQLRVKANFKDGVQDGLREGYFDNGQLLSRGNFKDGKEDGFFDIYDENGQLDRRVNFKDGVPKFAELYEKNGELVAVESYEFDNVDGRFIKVK